MKSSINNVNLSGWVASEIDLSTTQNGAPCVNFTMGYHFGPVHDAKDLHVHCCAFGPIATVISHEVERGDYLFIGGKLRPYGPAMGIEIKAIDMGQYE